MYCTNCGKELPSTDARVCLECGTAVETGFYLTYIPEYCPKCGEKTKGLVFDCLALYNPKFDKLKLLNIYTKHICIEKGCCQHIILQNIKGPASLYSIDIRCELKSLIIKDCDIEWLHCFYKLASLDLSGCSALKKLKCNKVELTSLDLSGSILEELECGQNHLTSLDLSRCSILKKLECDYNHLTSLDFSNNITLQIINCAYNKLATLDVSNNMALTELYCDGNQLTSLDVSNNTALRILMCSENQLTILDLRNNADLIWLNCRENPLRKIILYKYHKIEKHFIYAIKEKYGDIIEYVE